MTHLTQSNTILRRLLGLPLKLVGQWADSSPAPEPAPLIDALRRSTEILTGMVPENASEYWFEERDYILAVNRRLLRAHDPGHATDRTVR